MEKHPAEDLRLRDTLLQQDLQDHLVDRTEEVVVLQAEEGHTATKGMIQIKEDLCLQIDKEDHLKDTVETEDHLKDTVEIEDHLEDTAGTSKDHLVDMKGIKGAEEMMAEEGFRRPGKGK